MTTTTKRRTTKITKPVYEGVVLARVFTKTGIFLGYLAKPSKPVNAQGRVLPWYQVTRDESGVWHCKCKVTGDCKHAEAVREVEELRKAAAENNDEQSGNTATAEENVKCAEVTAVDWRERRLDTDAYEPRRQYPQARDASGAWHTDKEPNGDIVVFLGHPEWAERYMEVDTDEHRAATLAKMRQEDAGAKKEYQELLRLHAVYDRPVAVPKKAAVHDAPKGDLHGTQHRGGFLDACFGRSPEMAKYRNEFVAARVAK